MAEIVAELSTNMYVGGIVIDVEIRMANAAHTIAIVTVFPNGTGDVLAQSTPVVLTWGTNPNGLSTWYGYVHHFELMGDRATRTQRIQYVLIGTSAPMDSSRSRSWTNTSASYVVRSIAAEHGLRSLTYATGVVEPYIAQATESDFALCARIADEYGYRFWVDGSTAYFIDVRTRLLSPRQFTTPVFTFDQSGADTILAASMLQGTSTPTAGILADRTVYGVTRSNQVVMATSSNPDARISQVNADRPLTSYNQAARYVDAVAGVNAFWIKGEVTLRGNSAVLPGTLVYLDGSHLPNNMVGLWAVDSVTHSLSTPLSGTIQSGHFSTTAQLIRDESQGLSISQVIRTEASTAIVGCVLDNKRTWRSETFGDVIYGN